MSLAEALKTEAVVLAHLAEADDPDAYNAKGLHYGSDLWDGACTRKTALRITGAPGKPLTIGDRIRFWRGNSGESLMQMAFLGAGMLLDRQVELKPSRPSAAGWEGHADMLITLRGLGVNVIGEVKFPKAESFARAGDNDRRLVKDSWRWQLSAYVHEARERGLAEAGVFFVVDVEGTHGIRTIALEDVGEIPLEAIVAQEASKAHLLRAEPSSLPRPIPGQVEVKVWKGRGKNPRRRVEATARVNWQCLYCPYRGVSCDPGPDDVGVILTPAEEAVAVAVAERRWSSGDERSPQIMRQGDDLELAGGLGLDSPEDSIFAPGGGSPDTDAPAV